MATTSGKLDEDTLMTLKTIIWGTDIKDEVFKRWTQGFVFSEDEPTALVQFDGGPCAVIAPVQGYIIRQALFTENPVDNLSTLTEEKANELLGSALVEIMLEVSSKSGVFSVIYLEDDKNDDDTNKDESCSTSKENNETKNGESCAKRPKLDADLFHTRIRCTKCQNEDDLRTYVKSKLSMFQETFGVVLYLYSIILTKGIEQIKNEVEDPGEQFIDSIHGHGSQSLINLLLSGKAVTNGLSGKAVTNVWDNDKDISGLKLRGIPRQSTIGFLTLMEYMRYCEVGWYLKNPRFPIWMLGSETHLTVLFSKDENLIINESSKSSARHIFQRFDPEGNGFISTSLLGDLMSALDLVSEKEYVDIMTSKLDSESLGIITMHCFMEEFYPGDVIKDTPNTFELYHYNGIPRSCLNSKVKYFVGTATLPEELEVQIITDTSPIKLCLQTKWPSIEMSWTDNYIPSLN
ncbi:MINDY3_4 [Mytilus coruscus]|uniref:Ubiquitin carboxyl-terminal hydrolase MINDY n=1 Tax=Mytilus coruscus TaxID=42192 RepID=A0A6J8DTD9_MYTCO|nr:MINDY3_4 [Mytilus coruscus]